MSNDNNKKQVEENSKHDPVHKSEGHWWFWDETWADRIGPFPSYNIAERELSRYALMELEGLIDLTVWVTNDQVALIKKEASRNNMSVHQWCEYIIIKSAKENEEPPFFTGDNLY
jgi:hypothetical protein